jgi:hypothetical protein
MTTHRKNKAEAGNAILIVLIAIALFVALIFFLSKSSSYTRGETEFAALRAQEITTYAEKVGNAVQSMMMTNGCLAAQISFENAGDYINASSGNLCKVFHTNGGGMKFLTPPAESIDTAAAAAAGSALAGNYYFEGNACVTGMGTGPAASACSATTAELLIILPWVKEDVCRQINQIAMNSTDIPSVSAATFNGAKFTGTYAGSYTITTSGTTQRSGCYSSTAQASPAGTGYHYYAVLLAQ